MYRAIAGCAHKCPLSVACSSPHLSRLITKLDLPSASMNHPFSKSKAEGGDQDSKEVDAQPMTLTEMIEATKGQKLERVISRYQSWDCVAIESSSTTSWAKTLNDWADLAYKGCWEGLLRMVMGSPGPVTSRRLQTPTGAHTRPSSVYHSLPP